MKIYAESYDDYCAIREWANNQYITFFDGYTEHLLNAVYEDIQEEAFNTAKHIPTVNIRFFWEEVYFCRNCHIPFVQEALSGVCEDYSQIDLSAPPPDFFKKGRKIKIEPYPEYSQNSWVITSKDSLYGYNEYSNTWMHRQLPYPTYTTACDAGTLEEVKSILSNQYLHKGAQFHLRGAYVGEDYAITAL